MKTTATQNSPIKAKDLVMIFNTPAIITRMRERFPTVTAWEVGVGTIGYNEVYPTDVRNPTTAELEQHAESFAKLTRMYGGK